MLTKTGKRAFLPKAKDLKLARYLDVARLISGDRVPAAPSMLELPTPAGELPAWDGDSLGNDTIGLCVLAALAHQSMLVGQLTGVPVAITRDQVIALYSALTGYRPGNEMSDLGYEIRSALDVARIQGMWGHRVLAFASVDWTDPLQVEIAIWLGCGVQAGFQLPLAGADHLDARGHQLWDVPDAGWPSGQGPGSRGGHAVHQHAHSTARDEGISWGQRTAWTRPWQQACQDEAWLVLWDHWADAGRPAPNGFALADLLADARAR